MAYPTAVNDQITDAVTQSNVKVLAESAAVATSNLYQAASNSLSNSIQNATFGQQQSNLIHQATTTQGINLIYAVDTESVADATEKVAQADLPASALNLLLLQSMKQSNPYG
jgi:hypothetical protein